MTIEPAIFVSKCAVIKCKETLQSTSPDEIGSARIISVNMSVYVAWLDLGKWI